MGRYESGTLNRMAAIAAAMVVTLAIGGLIDSLFPAAPAFIGAQVAASSRAPRVTEVTIIPARIEVAGARMRHVAQGAAGARAAVPGS